MQKIVKRSLALILAVMLRISGLPFSAFAVESASDETVTSEIPPSEETEESSQPEPSLFPEPSGSPDHTSSPEPSAEPSEQPESTSSPTPPSEPSGGDDPYETEGASIDVTKVWPTGPRRAAGLASVGASSVLKIGNYCFANEYVLHEVSAPKGYELAEDIKFTVKDSGEPITIVMKDKPSGSVDTPQTGDRGWPLALAVFGVSLGGVVVSAVLGRKKKERDNSCTRD